MRPWIFQVVRPKLYPLVSAIRTLDRAIHNFWVNGSREVSFTPSLFDSKDLWVKARGLTQGLPRFRLDETRVRLKAFAIFYLYSYKGNAVDIVNGLRDKDGVEQVPLMIQTGHLLHLKLNFTINIKFSRPDPDPWKIGCDP